MVIYLKKFPSYGEINLKLPEKIMRFEDKNGNYLKLSNCLQDELILLKIIKWHEN